MPAVLSYTNELPFGGNYQSFRAPILAPPSEGPRTTPMSAKWLTDAQAPDYAVAVNFDAAKGTQQISQICALYVDNLSSDADAEFYFADTNFRLDVPARSIGLFPVVTNSLRFIAAAPNATDGDQTIWQVLNFNPPPVAVAKTFFSQATVSTGGALPTSAAADLAIPLVSGPATLTGIQIYFRGAVASAADAIRVFVVDSYTLPTVADPQLLFRSVSITTAAQDIVVFDITGMLLRAVTGISVVLHDVGSLVTGGIVDVNLQYSVT